MTGRRLRPWFSDNGEPFHGDEPFYFDTSAFPWVAQVEARWEEIRDELLKNLEQDERILEPYLNREMATRADSWRTLGLMFWTRRSRINCQRFPLTWSILKGIPGLTAASLNLLEPNTTIKPHVGNTNAIIRCHMGLVVPAPAPRCGFRVGTETRSWEPGKFLMFCDAHQHSAWNNTNGRRYILVVDVITPKFARSTVAISSRVLAGIYQEAIYQRQNWLKRYLGSSLAQAAVATFLRISFQLSLYTRGTLRGSVD
jgi:aspartyl/asparaginyl beta-hydroxylase (cupin superfamily)